MQATEKIWMNGELVDWDDAKVHVGAHGLHYGTGVFEGIRCYDTPQGPAVFRLRDHIERLVNSAQLLYMQLPYSVDELRAASMELICANGLPVVLPAADRLLRLRRARRRGARQPGRRRDHELAVGHVPRRRRPAQRHPREDLVVAARRPERRSRTSRRRPASTSTRCSPSRRRTTPATTRRSCSPPTATSRTARARTSSSSTTACSTRPISRRDPARDHARHGDPDRAGPRLHRRREEPDPLRSPRRRRGLHVRHRRRGDADPRGRRRRDRRRRGHARDPEGVPRHGDRRRATAGRIGASPSRTSRAPRRDAGDKDGRALARRGSTSATRSSCSRRCAPVGCRSGRRDRASRSCSPRRSARRTAPPSRAGRPALHLAMRLAGVGPGDEVITSPYLVRRVGELRDLRGRDAGLRGHRRADVQPRSGRGRGSDHRADEGDRRGRHLRLSVRARSAARALRAARAEARSGCVRGARRALQGAAARLARPPDDVRVLPEQADDDGRGRRADDERRATSTSCWSRCGTRDGSRRARGSCTAGSATTTGSTTSPRRSASARSRGSTRSSRRAPRSPSGTPSCSRASTSSRRSPTTTTTCGAGSSTSSGSRRAPIATRVAAHARARRRDGAVRPVDPPPAVHARALRLRRRHAARSPRTAARGRLRFRSTAVSRAKTRSTSSRCSEQRCRRAAPRAARGVDPLRRGRARHARHVFARPGARALPRQRLGDRRRRRPRSRLSQLLDGARGNRRARRLRARPAGARRRAAVRGRRVPGVVDQADLDARWINVVPALGVALAAALTLRAGRGGAPAETGSGSPSRPCSPCVDSLARRRARVPFRRRDLPDRSAPDRAGRPGAAVRRPPRPPPRARRLPPRDHGSAALARPSNARRPASSSPCSPPTDS